MLEELLNKVDDSRVLWVSPERQVTAGDVKRDIVVRRSMVALDRNQRVALEVTSTACALTWMLALDGFAEAVFLVPQSLQGAEAYEGLKQEFQPSLTVGEMLSGSETDSAKIGGHKFGLGLERRYATRWVLATSGTTGTPKLIEHTTASLIRTCKADLTRGKEFIWGLIYDPFRFAGLQVVLQALASGSQLVLCNGIENIADQAAFLRANNVNALSATPTYWRKLLISGTLKGHAFKQITLGGEPADQSILNALQAAFPSARVAHIYASTEAGVGFSVTDGLVGFPQGYLDEGVAGNNLSISAAGSLLIKPERHIPFSSGGAPLVNAEGFIDTGDLVEIRGNRVIFLGRDSGAINVGGNKVIPEEVEAVIREVAGVGEVVVRPKGSGVMGQLVTAEIQPLSADVDRAELKKNIIAHCRQRLEKYKVPALIRFVEDISYNPTGKISRT